MHPAITLPAFLCLSSTAFATSQVHAAELVVKVMNVASNQGNIIGTLCPKEAFMKNCTRGEMEKASRGNVILNYKNVTPGQYAVAVFHDENGNMKLDKDSYGIPIEGYAFSRNARGQYGPPSFDAASIDVIDGKNEITISLNY